MSMSPVSEIYYRAVVTAANGNEYALPIGSPRVARFYDQALGDISIDRLGRNSPDRKYRIDHLTVTYTEEIL